MKIANPNASDAIANMLMIEAVLMDKDFAIYSLHTLYKNHPSQKFKAPVAERLNFKTNADGTRLTEPETLQEYIDTVVGGIIDGRALIEPGQ